MKVKIFWATDTATELTQKVKTVLEDLWLSDFIEVDLAALAAFGDNIKVWDLKLDTAKYEILSDSESVLVSANEPAAEEDLSAPVVLELPKDEKASTETEEK